MALAVPGKEPPDTASASFSPRGGKPDYAPPDSAFNLWPYEVLAESQPPRLEPHGSPQGYPL